MKTLAKKLVHYRLQHHMSTKQVALLLGIAETAYAAIEKGKTELSVTQLVKLCAYYSISTDELLSGDTTTKKPAGQAVIPSKKVEPPPVDVKNYDNEPAGPRTKRPKRSKEKDISLEQRLLDHPELSADEIPFLDMIARIITDVTLKEVEDLEALEDSPGGYHHKEKRECAICGDFVSGAHSWYDAYGFKCMYCQTAINEGRIPAEIAKDKDLYYTEIGLSTQLSVQRKLLNSWVKQGLVRQRVIYGEKGKTHFRVFLLSENAAFLPPHELLRVGGPVKEVNENGLEEVAFYPWYCFVDPIEHLKDYGIVQFMRFVPVENPEQPKPNEGDNPSPSNANDTAT